MGRFQLQQIPFPFQAAGIASQGAVCTYDSMAGDDDCYRVAVDGTAYGLRRAATYALGNVTI